MKKSTALTLFAGIFVLSLFAAACKKVPGCTDPTSLTYNPDAEVEDGSCTYPQPQLSLQVHHMVGSLPYSTDSIYFTSYGRRYQFTKARFYFSKPNVLKSSGNLSYDKYLHVMAGQDTYAIAAINAGHYDGFSFSVGVDSVTNHSDPTLFPEGHALSITSNTQDHWTWNVGYVFLRLEGMVDTTIAMNGPLNYRFDYHVATDPLLRAVSLSKPFDVLNGKDYAFHMTIDWSRALYDIHLEREHTHTTDNFPLAERIMNNMITGISAN